MKQISRLFPILSLVLIVSACCHTNNLKEYKVLGESCLYRTSVDPGAAQVNLNINSPAPGASPVADVLASIGSGVLSSEAETKLHNAVKPIGIADAISDGLEREMKIFLKTRGVQSPDENPAFIIETLLKECSLHSGAGGIELTVKAQTEIISAATGKTVWRDCYDRSVSVRDTPAGYIPLPGVATAASIYNATEFFKLPEKEIQDLILSASESVGQGLAKNLRKDYSKL